MTLELKKPDATPSCIDAALAANPALEQSRALLAARLQKAGIDFPERFKSYDLLKEILTNREGGNPNDKRPLAVYVFPKQDWNGAFTVDNMAALTKDYRVMYYEADTDTDFANDLKDSPPPRKLRRSSSADTGTSSTLPSVPTEPPGKLRTRTSRSSSTSATPSR